MTSWERLLPGSGASGELRDLGTHHQVYGRLDLRRSAHVLIADIREAGLTGRGGAGFPSYRKLEAVRTASRPTRGRPVVIANGAEGEPASQKDKVLLTHAPHLVLDGLQVAARAVGASEAVIYVHEGPLVSAVAKVIEARRRARIDPTPTRVVSAPARFISGQETAVVSRVDGGLALPRSVPPPVYQRGVGRRPTLVNNVETLAHMALIARYGGAWFRGLGTEAEPGTMLFTVSGAVQRPGVLEAPIGVDLDQLLGIGQLTSPVHAVLIGGYHGTWIEYADGRHTLSDASLQSVGARLGAGVVVALPASTCGLVETSRVVTYLANESARQCGPCLNGLPAIAHALTGLARGRRDPSLPAQIETLSHLVEGRGACRHPDGTARMAGSALRVFQSEIDLHLVGRCSATAFAPILPTGERPARESVGVGA
jgi:NADH:ubiquinone oxidoreductase subunit F (NADH-binding)